MGEIVSTRRDGSRTEEIYRALRERIRHLVLKPGALIVKDAIAEEFGVSRAPVHDALTRLADEGLVEIAPQRGSFVAPIRVQDVRESLFTRMALECEAMRHAAEKATPELIAALDANLAAQERALSGAIEDFYKLDEELHKLICGAMGFDRALRFLDTARPMLDRIRPIVLPHTTRAERTFSEHRRLVEAIRMGDPEFAAAAMRNHLRSVERSIEAWAVFAERSEEVLGNGHGARQADGR